MVLLKSPLRLAKWPIIISLAFLALVLYLGLRRRSPATRLKISLAIFNRVYRLWGSGKERIETNLSLIRPDLEGSEISRGAQRIIETLARSWAAIIGNRHTSLDEMAQKCEVSGVEPLLEQYRAGNKIVIAVDHVGPFDELLALPSILGLKAYVPVERIRPEWLLRAIMHLRSSFGNIIMEPVKKGESLSRAAHYLAQGRVVVFPVDMTRREGRGVLCRIGAAQARFPVGVMKLAIEEGAAVFPAFPSCSHNGEARIEFGPFFEIVRTGNKRQDIEANTRRLIEGLYAPHIQENWDAWMRSLWSNLEPAQQPAKTMELAGVGCQS